MRKPRENGMSWQKKSKNFNNKSKNMKKTVKVGWVFFISIQKRLSKGEKRIIRLANSLNIFYLGYELIIGMPWSIYYVTYNVQNRYGKQVEGIEKDNNEMIASPGFKLRMPKIKYTL